MTGNLIERRVLQVARDRMTEAPVVALQGARSVGKSTVLAQLAAEHCVRVIDLDDPTERARAKASPSDIIDGADPVCVDEYQHVPEVLQAIKAQLNRRHADGRFVITGSSSFWALPEGTQSLTGRIQLLEVMPFSQGEIDGTKEDFLDIVFADPEHFRRGKSETTREAYAERVCRGGLPLAINESQRTRGRFYNSIDIVMERFDGSVICFEVKAAREVDTKDTAGLFAIRAALGDQFHAGFVLTTGEQSYRHDDRIYICPIDRLWATNSQHDDT